MELVRGVKITTYCDQQKLSTRQRLDLFIQVCQAVQHAHQKGIIHRDIKPSNILVTEQDGAPTPKIIDFGIAKATTDQRLTDKTLFTAFEQFLGTPAYMSPEQAGLGGMDIDTRSDIYSLGVLLYELLTGHPPFDSEKFARSALDEIMRVIREEEPPRPSTRLTTLTEQELTTVAQRRQIESARLPKLVRGDLDGIVMKALDKDRRRRYDTANGLAHDLQRFVGNEPVVARPPSTVYRILKFAHRNKLAFAAGAVVMLAVSLGLGISTWSLIKERHARQLAAAEASKSEQVAKFLGEMLKGVNPANAKGRDTTILREILDEAARRVARDLHNQPDVEAELRSVIGWVYNQIGEANAAAAMHREAAEIWKKRGDALRAMESLNELGLAGLRSGNLVEAETAFREALAMKKTLRSADHIQVVGLLHWMRQLLVKRAECVQAEALHREALAIRLKLPGSGYPDAVALLADLGEKLRCQGKFSDAERAFREALTEAKAQAGSEHPSLYRILMHIALACSREGKSTEARQVLRELVALKEKMMLRLKLYESGLPYRERE